ncbi:hypothetical protein Q3G72_023675 [Acer saccharum]|nr:hypothetical protein Q3G72_023675 [Acer saccharum]
MIWELQACRVSYEISQSSRMMIICKCLTDNVADEARMLDEYLEKQRRFEHEASLKASVSGSGNKSTDSRE